MKCALAIGVPRDPQIKRVTAEIRALGGAVLRCDTSAFPGHTRISLQDGRLRIGQREIPPLQACYARALGASPLLPDFAEDLRTRPRGLLAQCDETRALLVSILKTLERNGVRVVNPVHANEQHSEKPYQLELLRSAGLPVPRSLATNDPAAVRRFVRDVGQAVYKPLAGGATVRSVEPVDLNDDRLELLKTAPVLFQERIEGTPVRAYVVGKRVVAAAEIISDDIDYRRNEQAVVSTRLSPHERRTALAAAEACGMLFAGVDLIRSAKKTWILECNPSPMFAVFEKKTGADVAGPLAKLLLRGHRKAGVPRGKPASTRTR